LKTIIFSTVNLNKVVLMMIVFYLLSTTALFAQDKDSTVTKTDSSTAKSDSSDTKADSTNNKKLSLDAYPYAYYTPETELAFGAGGILIFFSSDSVITKPSKIVLGGYYTTNSQYYLSLDPELYFFSNDLFISMPLSFGYFVSKFYGIGPATPDTGNVDYTSRVYSATLSVLGPSQWLTANKAGIVFDYNYTQMVDTDTNYYIQDDDVLGSNGGAYLGVGLNAVWDTRNNIFFPTDGKYTSIKFVSYPVGEFIYYTTELDIKSYSSFSKNHVFAAEIYNITSLGKVPFYALPQLGGQYKMRGYYQGRYVDNSYFTMQVAYRREDVWGRFGFVLFASTGTVAPSPDKYQLSEMKFSYGAGLRYLFNEKEGVNLRVDLGITTEGETGVYFGIGEAF